MDRQAWMADKVTEELHQFLKGDQALAKEESLASNNNHPNPAQVTALNVAYCRGRVEMAQDILDWGKEDD